MLVFIMKNKIITSLIFTYILIFVLSPLSAFAANSSGGGEDNIEDIYSVRCETENGVIYYYPEYQTSDIYFSEPGIFKTEDGYALIYFKQDRSYYIDANGEIFAYGQGIYYKIFTNLKDVEYELFEKGVNGTFSGYQDVSNLSVQETIMISEKIIDGDSGEYNSDYKTLTEYYENYKLENPDEELIPIEQGKYIICQYYQTIQKDKGKDNEKEYKYALIKVPDACEKINYLTGAAKFGLMAEDWFVNSTIDWGKYAIATHELFSGYDETQKFRIFCFDSLKEAVMYQLYGGSTNNRQGSIYNFRDNYAVNITEFLYSNVTVGDFYNPIDVDNYQYEENFIVLKQHNSETHLKIYYDYKPYVNSIIKDKYGNYRFSLADERFTWLRVYVGTFNEDGEATSESISADGWDLLTEDDNYYYNRKDFYLYSPNSTNPIEDEVLHDIIFSTNEANLLNFEVDENGNLTGETSKEQLLHNVVDENGDRYTYNKITNTYVKEDDFFDPFTDEDGDGIYENSKGDKLDPTELTDLTQNRLDEQVLDAGLNGIVEVFSKFPELIKQFSVQMDQSGKLVNGLINQIPYEIISLISLSLISLIIVRFVKERGQ